ncbi:MAG TPA: transposase [Candidatus Enterococcus avicola]|uniref:Transposase n=1 Tax=Candidatus Enterococcus avicola TaxID=2838561 RepID=A0A9D2F7L3_9ENTE|nr:transposase [Candidatus Enterococcus avicola]
MIFFEEIQKEIQNAFKFRCSKGVTEGLNNKIK